MRYCYDCGICLQTRVLDGKMQIYDSEREVWLDECPSCEGRDFYGEGDEYEALIVAAK